MDINVSGIYQIGSTIKPSRIYIGSSINISTRWSLHKSDLKLGKHINAKMQNHYNKYGEDDFVFTIIEQCPHDSLITKEQLHMDNLNPYFNIRKIAASNLGLKMSDETKKKLSEGRTGEKHHNYGKKASDETKRKMSESQKKREHRRGFKLSDETKKKLSEANSGEKHYLYGKQMPGETKNKLSESHKGQIAWNKGKKSNKPAWNKGLKACAESWNKGMKMSDEHCKKLSDAHLGQVAWNKGKKTGGLSDEHKKKISDALIGRKKI